MRVVVYCAATYEEASRKAAGRDAILFTCPPCSDTNLYAVSSALQAADLILFNLHGLPDSAAWFAYRSGPPAAIRAHQLAELDLTGAVVFAENCYTGNPGDPMHQALEETGCKAIIAGSGENYGGSVEMAGADWLFWLLRQAMELSEQSGYQFNIERIIRYARFGFGLSKRLHNRDTAQFEVWRRGERKEYIV